MESNRYLAECIPGFMSYTAARGEHLLVFKDRGEIEKICVKCDSEENAVAYLKMRALEIQSSERHHIHIS